MSWYDIKPSDGEAPGNMDYSFITIAPRFTLTRIVTTDRVLSMGQIEQTVCKQMTDDEFWLSYSNT